MNLPCIDGGTQPFDLSSIAKQPGVGGANWTGSAATLYTKMMANNVTPLPLAASGAGSSDYTGVYNNNDGYWTPSTQGDGTPWPVIKGFIKIEEQTAYGSPCGTWKDVTLEILSYGYVGRNIDPVSQSLDGVHLNPQWVQNTTTMESGAGPRASPSSAGDAGLLAGHPRCDRPVRSESEPKISKYFHRQFHSHLSIFRGHSVHLQDPHPWAVIRLERIRDNPSSVAVQTGKLSAHSPKVSTAAQVCGVDPSTGAVLAGWTPQVYDFWPNVLFDTREGTLRDTQISAANLPTLNGTMHYIEVDGKNLASWFGGKINTITTSGQSTRDPSGSTEQLRGLHF